MNNDNNPTTLRNMENNNPPDIHLKVKREELVSNVQSH